MKIAIWVLKIAILILTSIWGIIFGIFAPLSIMLTDMVDPAIAEHIIIKIWLINSIVCYITGTVLLMLNLYKTAACFHTVGMIVSIVIYGVFQGLYEGQDAENPAGLYMPIIFVTLLSILTAFLANKKNIERRLADKKDKEYEAAPSVLGGEYKYTGEKGKGNNKGQDKGKNKGKNKR